MHSTYMKISETIVMLKMNTWKNFVLSVNAVTENFEQYCYGHSVLNRSGLRRYIFRTNSLNGHCKTKAGYFVLSAYQLRIYLD